MAYDNPVREEYIFNAVNLASAFSRNIRGPQGLRGRVVRAEGSVTTTSTGTPTLKATTTAAPIAPSPTPNTPVYPAVTDVLVYAIGALTAPMGFASTRNSLLRDANNNLYVTPADTDIVFSLVPGGAGVADIKLIVDWV